MLNCYVIKYIYSGGESHKDSCCISSHPLNSKAYIFIIITRQHHHRVFIKPKPECFCHFASSTSLVSPMGTHWWPEFLWRRVPLSVSHRNHTTLNIIVNYCHWRILDYYLVTLLVTFWTSTLLVVLPLGYLRVSNSLDVASSGFAAEPHDTMMLLLLLLGLSHDTLAWCMLLLFLDPYRMKRVCY